MPTDWRTEYWHDMQVDVPADWGYGGAPMDFGGGDTVACYATAMVTADGQRLKRDDPTMPYVGRPIALTDVCQKYPFIGPDAGPPDAPYVWLGAAVEPGTEDLGDGWVQETVEVNGSTADRGHRRHSRCASGSSHPPAGARPACPTSTPRRSRMPSPAT